jgi:hypothetical protein
LASDQERQAGLELQQAVVILEGIVRSDQTNAGWRRDLAEAVAVHGEVQLAVGGIEAAASDAERALRLTDESLAQSADDRDASRIGALALLLKADVFSKRGNRAETDKSCRLAFSRLEPLVSRSSDYRVLVPWARALACVGRRGEAQTVVERLDAMGYRSAPLTRSMALRER